MKQQRPQQKQGQKKSFDVQKAKARAEMMVAARTAADLTGKPLWLWVNIMKWRQGAGKPLDISRVID